MPLPEDRLTQFRKLGFVNAGPLFDASQLEAIGKEYDRLVTYEAQGTRASTRGRGRGVRSPGTRTTVIRTAVRKSS
jgi:hypothetical protein